MSWVEIATARARGRWLLLVAGLSSLLALALMVVLVALAPQSMGGCFSCGPAIAGIPSDLVMPLVGTAGAAFGLLWMWRIYRAPTRFLEARWRYRDR